MDQLQPAGKAVQLIAAFPLAVLTILLRDDDLGHGLCRPHLGLQLPLELQHALMAHGLVPTGIDADLDAIQRHLDDQTGKSLQMAAKGITVRAVSIAGSRSASGRRRIASRYSRLCGSWEARSGRRAVGAQTSAGHRPTPRGSHGGRQHESP